MTYLTDQDLAFMRAEILKLLPGTCNILEATRTIGGQGETIESWGTASAKVKCRMDRVRGGMEIAGQSLQSFADWMISLPYDVSISTDNRIEFGDQTFTVELVDGIKSWNAVTRAALKEIL